MEPLHAAFTSLASLSYNLQVAIPISEPQTLLFDADDTLWENNIYFERAIAAFISCLDHQVHTPQEVRQHLNSVEHATIAIHGYGLQSFRRSLIECFEQLAGGPPDEQRHRQIVSFADSIAQQQIELLPGVEDTLHTLARTHRLLLVTKGDPVEQRDKLTRSGLEDCFSGVEVLAEKNVAAYRELILRHNLTRSSSWMIGNSPKSDINPAMAAGLNAVFVPHGFTWVLEHETIATPPETIRLLELAALQLLTHHF